MLHHEHNTEKCQAKAGWTVKNIYGEFLEPHQDEWRKFRKK